MNLEFLQSKGYPLPEVKPAVASYLPYKIHGNQIWISGQLPWWEGKLLHPGIVGDSVRWEDAKKASEICSWNALGCILALGTSSVEILKISVFVASHPQFQEQHLVANGASEFFFGVFGEKGRHARSAVGVASLPLGSCVEVEVQCSFNDLSNS